MGSAEELAPADALAELRAVLRCRAEFDRLLEEAVRRACVAGVPRAAIARALGVHRATFYRQFAGTVTSAEQGYVTQPGSGAAA